MDRYADMTQDDFDRILRNLARADGTDLLIDIPDVWDAVAEHYNNAVLSAWENDNPEQESDPDAPVVGDLIFDPDHQGVALQSPCDHVQSVYGLVDMDTYEVNDGLHIQFYDSAWHLVQEGNDNDETP